MTRNLPACQLLHWSALTVLLLLGGCYRDEPPAAPESVLPTLVSLLDDQNPEIRRTAALSLGKFAAPETVPDLVLALDDPDSTVRRYGVWALGNMGEASLDQAGDAVVEMLEDPSPDVKAAAALALGKLGGTQGMVELVAQYLRDPDVATRRAATLALGGMEAASASPALIEALTDEDAFVRQGALAALGELADVRALPAIGDRLRRDVDGGVRSEAAFRLGKLGDGNGMVGSLLQTASAGDPDPGVRRWAAWALASLHAQP